MKKNNAKIKRPSTKHSNKHRNHHKHQHQHHGYHKTKQPFQQFNAFNSFNTFNTFNVVKNTAIAPQTQCHPSTMRVAFHRKLSKRP